MPVNNKFLNSSVLTNLLKVTSGKKSGKVYQEAEKAAKNYTNKSSRTMKIPWKTPEAPLKKVWISKKRRTSCRKVSGKKPTSLNQSSWPRKSWININLTHPRILKKTPITSTVKNWLSKKRKSWKKKADISQLFNKKAQPYEIPEHNKNLLYEFKI